MKPCAVCMEYIADQTLQLLYCYMYMLLCMLCYYVCSVTGPNACSVTGPNECSYSVNIMHVVLQGLMHVVLQGLIHVVLQGLINISFIKQNVSMIHSPHLHRTFTDTQVLQCSQVQATFTFTTPAPLLRMHLASNMLHLASPSQTT